MTSEVREISEGSHDRTIEVNGNKGKAITMKSIYSTLTSPRKIFEREKTELKTITKPVAYSKI